MTREQHLLIRAMEECNELAQRISKALVFGLDENQVNPEQNPENLNNRDRIYFEYYDLRAVLGMAGIDAWDASDRARKAENAKRRKVEKYLQYSKELGLYEPPVQDPQHDWEFYANGSFCRRCGAAIGSEVPCR